jgi:hypothetical protein
MPEDVLECEPTLKVLESWGIRVIRAKAEQEIAVARSQLLSLAFQDGYVSLLLMDCDVMTDCYTVMRCLARPEGVITAGSLEGQPPGMYPIDQVGAGFLRIREESLRQVIEKCKLELISDHKGIQFWHFFQEQILTNEQDEEALLNSEAAFSRLLRLAGITAIADTSMALTVRRRRS